MLRITVEIIPHGIEDQKRILGTMEIVNDGTGTRRDGNYAGRLHAEYTDATGRRGYVRSFRRQGQSVWSLVGAFLKLWGHTKHSPKLMSKQPPERDIDWENGPVPMLPDWAITEQSP